MIKCILLWFINGRNFRFRCYDTNVSSWNLEKWWIIIIRGSVNPGLRNYIYAYITQITKWCWYSGKISKPPVNFEIAWILHDQFTQELWTFPSKFEIQRFAVFSRWCVTSADPGRKWGSPVQKSECTQDANPTMVLCSRSFCRDRKRLMIKCTTFLTHHAHVACCEYANNVICKCY